MTIEHLHRPLTTAMSKWMVEATNPNHDEAVHLPWGADDDPSDLLEAASLHGVLPAVLRQLISSVECVDKYPALQNSIKQRIEQAGWELALKAQGNRALKALADAGVDCIMIKGATHAKCLYNIPADRTYTDIDLLVPSSQRDIANRAMEIAGFELFSHQYRTDRDYCEDVWFVPDSPDFFIEIHTNLAHNPKLRRAISVAHEDVLSVGKGNLEDATLLLFIAATHSAIGHQFDRLQHLVDISLAVSGVAGSIDVERLKKTSVQCGAHLAVITALLVTAKVFDDNRCRQLAKRLEPSLNQRASIALFSFNAIVNARCTNRFQTSWRRKLFRVFLRWGA